jgi:cytochrome c oxidase subunit II
VAGPPPDRLIPLPDSTIVSVRLHPIMLAVAAAVALGAAGCADDAPSDPGAADEGREIATRAGCNACHGADGEGGIGPAWAGSIGTEIELDDGTTVTIDEAYLERAITDPAAEIHTGFSVTMPENQLTEEEVAQVIDYIVSLGG